MPKPFSSNLDDWCSLEQPQRALVKRGLKVKHTDDALAVAASHHLSLLGSSMPCLFLFWGPFSWVFHYGSRLSVMLVTGWTKIIAGQGRDLPQTSPPTLSALMHSGRSLHAFFFSFLRAPVGLQRQQIVIESNLVLKDDSWHLSPSREKRESLVCVTGFWTSLW